MESKNHLAILCRELNPRTGEVSVYEVETDNIDDGFIAKLSIRARINMDLRYFAVPRVRWESQWGKDYRDVLKCKKVTQEGLDLIGGIVEI